MQTKSEWEKMLAGEDYRAVGPEIEAAQIAAARFMERYNAAEATDWPGRAVMLKEMFGACGENVVVRPPFHVDFGRHIFAGSNVFVNFGCVILDVARVEIGDGCQIGPYVQILTPDHPRDPALRRAGLESAKPIAIGKNAWIGGGAIILPGVRIGDDCIIGAGSVVTRDVPAGATAMGNPARAKGASSSH